MASVGSSAGTAQTRRGGRIYLKSQKENLQSGVLHPATLSFRIKGEVNFSD